jgi:hypothetical protein
MVVTVSEILSIAPTALSRKARKPGPVGYFGAKFDKPIPAVRLVVKADEKLYSAWQHMPVDEYPRVKNLKVVQAKTKIPTFLREVYERNQAGALTNEYEDW